MLAVVRPALVTLEERTAEELWEEEELLLTALPLLELLERVAEPEELLLERTALPELEELLEERVALLELLERVAEPEVLLLERVALEVLVPELLRVS